MAKRKLKNKQPPAEPVVTKKAHVEKEESFAESYEKFKQTRASDDAHLIKKLSKFYECMSKVEKSPQAKERKDDSQTTKVDADKIFQPIVHATLIHLCNHEDESLDGLQDLLKCWSKCKKLTKKGSGDTEKPEKAEKEEKEEESDEPVWADVAMDAVISMLPSCNNRCLRLLMSGLKRITHHTTLNVVESITAPLTGLEDEDEESSDDDEDNDDDTMQTDEEANESASDGDVDEAMEQDVSGDEDEWEAIEEEEEGEEESKELEKLKAKLHGILYSAKSDKTCASETASEEGKEDDDESENEVDDEAMFALDDAIAQAFKEKFASKKSVLDAKAETFKCRMLKLIECYASQRERKENIIILITLSILPLMKAPSSTREFKCKLIETLTHIFDIKNRKFTPLQDKQVIESLETIFKLFINQASKAKNSDESTVYAKGINWVLKIHPSPLSLGLTENINVSTVTSSTFVTLSHMSSRSTALQLVKSLVNHLTGNMKEELKPLQLAHAYEIISHALTKFLQNNGRDELPSEIVKQVCDLTKDTATQLSSQINDGKCNWLLLSSVIQILNYLKIIFTHKSQQFTLDNQLIDSLKQITGKNRKKLPKPGQIALKCLFSGSKGKKTKKKKNKSVTVKVDENTPSTNSKGAHIAPATTSNSSQVKKSKIPLPKNKLIKKSQ